MRKTSVAAIGALGLSLVVFPAASAIAAVEQPIPVSPSPVVMNTGIEQMTTEGWFTPLPGGTELYVNGDIVATAASELPVHVGENDGYNRTEQFGPAWNVKIDGCDTRNRILQRDFVSFTTDLDGDDCTVTTGVFDDPYSGEVIDFQRTNYPESGDGNSSAVQIDHMIPLKAAWNGGAEEWTQDQREAFANDPANLWASKGSENGSKGDRLLGDWYPTNLDFYCQYAAKQTWLLTTYELSVAQSDKDALISAGEACAFDDVGTAPTIGDYEGQMLSTDGTLVFEMPVTGGPLTDITFSNPSLTPRADAEGVVRDSTWKAEVLGDDLIRVTFTIDADATWSGTASANISVTNADGLQSDLGTINVGVLSDAPVDPTDPPTDPTAPSIVSDSAYDAGDLAKGVEIPFSGFPADEKITFSLTLRDGTPLSTMTVTSDGDGAGVIIVTATNEDGSPVPNGTEFTITADGYEVYGEFVAVSDSEVPPTDPTNPTNPTEPTSPEEPTSPDSTTGGTVEGTPEGELAWTGSDSAPMLIAGGIALLALIGGTAIFLVRRRRRSDAEDDANEFSIPE